MKQAATIKRFGVAALDLPAEMVDEMNLVMDVFEYRGE